MSSNPSTPEPSGPPVSETAPGGTAAIGETNQGWTTPRTIATVFAGIGAFVGLLLVLAGVALVSLHAFARDDDGFYKSGNEQLQSDNYAVAVDHIDLGGALAGPDPTDFVDDFRIEAESQTGEPVFIGIGPTSQVDRYLQNVAYSEVVELDGRDVRYRQRPGDERPAAPGSEQFWVASSEGAGEQRVVWDVESGVWSVVVMNADAARSVDVDASVGVQIGWLIWAGIGLGVIGLVLLGGCVVAIIVVTNRAATPSST